MPKIIFTGGGSAGHVTVNLSLIPCFRQEGWSVEYIGSENGIEKELITALGDVPYSGISTGKLRRYFSWQNLKDPFRAGRGVLQAYSLIRRSKPDVLFSKGGFVSVPVVIGAWLNRVPVVIHESDVTPGLANRLAIPLAQTVCTTFPETNSHLPAGKAHYVGPLVRPDLKEGKAERGRSFCGFNRVKPVLLIMGGSLGSHKINETVRSCLPELLARFQVVHLCGKGQGKPAPSAPAEGYRPFDYLKEELADVLAMTDVVVTRAGANVLFEMRALKKPMLLIPLSKEQSRGDQLLNAASFRASGYAEVLQEENLTPEALVREVTKLYENRTKFKLRMAEGDNGDALRTLVAIIHETAGVS
ncbi:undecaprenyldiphospho-muramoylpentapeptide beta-N-acetylglucosaminyltransferase [Paenibacillus aurantius]|uniref:UDP-N-acetylglucosamine--N-acetylmuramyl-(pentapeptide) pyrophosphoryl-undecaprenol N-acetylglucosamine transferase n=1 Tax=Paenibacillus aurantius TaxID=2918900 RepID=A0AA96LFR7_9BACL|nr:undecaprenyldiphospho-muramoylpentapeptide beta-N-acetylglucosaminyltransferase [Paenibacillus aurantius]WNQ10712.1 undecaprenyldiphospho-muramoylpentapeptide beta-N-acetylglucosaminyltransferase [Paenibacillus aurantius]